MDVSTDVQFLIDNLRCTPDYQMAALMISWFTHSLYMTTWLRCQPTSKSCAHVMAEKRIVVTKNM